MIEVPTRKREDLTREKLSARSITTRHGRQLFFCAPSAFNFALTREVVVTYEHRASGMSSAVTGPRGKNSSALDPRGPRSSTEAVRFGSFLIAASTAEEADDRGRPTFRMAMSRGAPRRAGSVGAELDERHDGKPTGNWNSLSL